MTLHINAFPLLIYNYSRKKMDSISLRLTVYLQIVLFVFYSYYFNCLLKNVVFEIGVDSDLHLTWKKDSLYRIQLFEFIDQILFVKFLKYKIRKPVITSL